MESKYRKIKISFLNYSIIHQKHDQTTQSRQIFVIFLLKRFYASKIASQV